MKNSILFCLLIIICSCKEPLTPQHQLFISFEKDGIFQSYDGTELSTNPRFTTHFQNDGFISKLRSKSFYISETPIRHDESLAFTFWHVAESTPFPKENIDTLFSLGQMELRTSFPQVFQIPSDTTFSYLDNVRYLIFDEDTSSPRKYKAFDMIDCDSNQINFIEITKIEKVFSEDGEVKNLIIEADFEVLLCSGSNDEVKLENGKLRYLFNVE